MPRSCEFEENIILHRSARMARNKIRNGKQLIGVFLDCGSAKRIINNIDYISMNANRYFSQHSDELPSYSTWCTNEEWEHNWPVFANALIRKLSWDCRNFDDTTTINASEMPKYSIGVNKHLDVILRDRAGRWIYLVKHDSTLEVVVSDNSPDCKVVCMDGQSNNYRTLSPNAYWTAIRGASYALVRPPIGCPTDIEVPYGGFLNSRFPFEGDNGYLISSGFVSQTIVTGDSEVALPGYPTSVLYGQLVLHEDDDKFYYTITPLYPDKFGARFTRKYTMRHTCAFSASPSMFCSFMQNETNMNARPNRPVDCFTGSLISSDPTTRYMNMPTTEATFKQFFVRDESSPNKFRPVYSRMMDIDENGNKTYSYFEDEDWIFKIIRTSAFGGFNGDVFSYNNVNYVWDDRNRAWIREEYGAFIPLSKRMSGRDLYVHVATVPHTTCPICNHNSIFTNEYDLIYFRNGERRRVSLCDQCINTVNNGRSLSYTDDDGEHLYITNNNLVRLSSDSYTLLDWYVFDNGDGDWELIDNVAEWNEETHEWQLPENLRNDNTLQFTDRGWCIREKFCTCIHSYFYKPAPVFFKDDSDDTSKFLGVELEVMDGGESSSNARTVCKDHEEVYAKHDGSLTRGMEVVSHPCTVSWHLHNLWDSVLSRLHSMNYHARSGSGIHVHVSKQYWKDNGGLQNVANLIAFCDINREALRIYAGRTSEMFDRWTSRYMSPSKTREALEQNVREYGDTSTAIQSLYNAYDNTSDHYHVVNLTNEHTVEIRAFASTLNINRMHSIIQFVDVLTELSTEATLANPITFEKIKERATAKGYVQLLLDAKFIDATSGPNVDTRFMAV